jgi:hypothetical protein
MPRTTHAYPFEAKVGSFAATLSQRFTAGNALRSFLLILDDGGNVRLLTFEDVRATDSADIPHLFYDPLEDGMEYVWLSWHRVEQPAMERLLGEMFSAADFCPDPTFANRARKLDPEGRFPTSWGVMF